MRAFQTRQGIVSIIGNSKSDTSGTCLYESSCLLSYHHVLVMIYCNTVASASLRPQHLLFPLRPISEQEKVTFSQSELSQTTCRGVRKA